MFKEARESLKSASAMLTLLCLENKGLENGIEESGEDEIFVSFSINEDVLAGINTKEAFELDKCDLIQPCSFPYQNHNLKSENLINNSFHHLANFNGIFSIV